MPVEKIKRIGDSTFAIVLEKEMPPEELTSLCYKLDRVAKDAGLTLLIYPKGTDFKTLPE